jgi:hypothetical protein
MGPLCVEHDEPVTRVFVRGRPWNPPRAAPAPTLTMSTLDAVTLKAARRVSAPRPAVRALR